MITIYTVVTDDYCDVNIDQDYLPNVKYVCFSDKPIDLPKPWENRLLKNPDNLHPTRLSRLPKIKSHKFFEPWEKTIYVDAQCCLNIQAVTKAVILLDNRNIVNHLHPTRDNYVDEMMFMYFNGLITEQEIFDKTEELVDEGYDFYDHVCVLNSFIARINTPYTKDFENLWWEEYLKFECYANRDQLPWSISLTKSRDRSKHCFLGKDIFTTLPTRKYVYKKRTSHPNFRPDRYDLARVQSKLIALTNQPMINGLILSKPL
jgi:hypothetical protein